MKKTFYLILFIIALTFSCQITMAAASERTPSNPNSAKECAICHYRWIDTFFIEGRGSDLVPYQSEKIAATQEMCFSCHDGSVADSRAIAFNDYMHKIDVPAPAQIKIPAVFPLGKNRSLTCATCHTPHGVPSGPDSDETIFMRFSNKNSAMCQMCHADMAGSPTVANHPLGQMKQQVPLELITRGALVGRMTNQVICETCHAAHGSPNERFLVQSAGNAALCLTCHQDKNALTSDGKKRPNHVINIVPGKATIPVDFIQNGAELGPNNEIICLTCHKVHKNKIQQQLLIFRQDTLSTLCLKCHTNKSLLADTKHNLMRSAPKEKNARGQTASEGGICSACHLPHGAARTLSDASDEDFTTRLCMGCHREGNIAGKIKLSGNTHPLNINPFAKKTINPDLKTVDTDEKKLGLPLFNEIGIQVKNGNMTCSTCHDPHGIPNDSTKNQNTKQVDATSYFLRKQSSTICKECHRNKFSVSNTKHDLSQMAPEATNMFNQTPVQSGLCGTCHAIHGSEKGFLWGRLPVKDNGADSRDLCASCHNENGLAKKKIVGNYSHPVNIATADKKLTTTLPLFEGQGVVTCYSCHDPHRGPAAAAAAESASNQMTPAAFLRMPAMDLCKECHSVKFSVANSKHDLNKVAPEEKNILNQTPARSGLCGSCHIVHGSQQEFLWARAIRTENSDFARELCDSCHNEKGPAKKKIIGNYSHPRNISPADKGLTTTLPLFDQKGRTAPGGSMTCHTCHDPHRWDPAKTISAAHYSEEGSSQNSFLRMQNSPSPRLCENCHTDKAYLEKTDHDLAVSLPSFKNGLDQTPAESGPCGACHLVHNSKNQFKLWALDFGTGDSVMAGLCTACHSKNGVAGVKTPEIASHPEGKLITNIGRNQKGTPNYFPIFDKTTGEPVQVGDISCPSCHNVHQWDAASPTKGNGNRVEGNAGNSFLRMRSDQFLCNDCHGVEALYRLYYFHVPAKRLFFGE